MSRFNEVSSNTKELIKCAFKSNESFEYLSADLKVQVIGNEAFPALRLSNIFPDEFIAEVKNELLDREFYKKSNDLYEFAQSEDLKLIDTPTLSALREKLSSQEWIDFIRGLTGIDLIPAKMSLAGQIYRKGGYLACHDDDIHGEEVGRRIAFILYLVEPTWSEEDGGCLELIQADHDGFPSADISQRILPQWNTMALFEVTPNSYHRVAEVLGDKERVSLTGWFYGKVPAEFLMAKKAVYIPRLEFMPSGGAFDEWETLINPVYIKDLSKANEVFLEESSIELRDFLTPEAHSSLKRSFKAAEWIYQGPLSSHSFFTIEPNDETRLIEVSLRSKGFSEWIERLTSIKPTGFHFSWHKFTNGSYTLCHDKKLEAPGLDLLLFIDASSDDDWDDHWGGQVVYMSEDEHLLSLFPANNKLSVVYCDESLLKFVKFVSCHAPGDLFLLWIRVEE